MPETKFGTCPWCERHEQVLYFVIGQYSETRELWCGWICARCLDIARQLGKEAAQND